MASPLLIVAIALAVLAVVFFLGGLFAIRRGRLFGTAMSLAAALLVLSLAFFVGIERVVGGRHAAR